MGIPASSNTVGKAVAPVSESGNISNKVLQKFHSTYNAINVSLQKDSEDKKNEHEALENSASDNALAQESDDSGLFILLNNYHFKDFMELVLSLNEAELNLIIKKNRAKRGVSSMLPVSSNHKSNKQFMNRISDQYLNVGWLMDSKPGQSYSAVW